jgi:hypothetical protein
MRHATWLKIEASPFWRDAYRRYRLPPDGVRGQATHDITCFTARPRVLDDFPPDFLPSLRRWFPRLAVELMNERRTGLQRWLLLTAKTPVSASRAAEIVVAA